MMQSTHFLIIGVVVLFVLIKWASRSTTKSKKERTEKAIGIREEIGKIQVEANAIATRTRDRQIRFKKHAEFCKNIGNVEEAKIYHMMIENELHFLNNDLEPHNTKVKELMIELSIL